MGNELRDAKTQRHKGSVTFSVCYRYFGVRKTRRAAEKKVMKKKKFYQGEKSYEEIFLHFSRVFFTVKSLFS